MAIDVVRVKICGITRERDLKAAVGAGADAVGFIVGFESSPRNISLQEAAELIALLPPFVVSVLVTTGEVVLARAKEVGAIHPDAIQFYGKGADADKARGLTGASLIRPYLVGREKRDAVRVAARFDALLVDGSRNGLQGGTGIAPNWKVCAKIRREIEPMPLILSGGLRPETVGDAIRAVRPYAVDVSSGVEASPGIKDRAKVMDFVRNARSTED